MIPPHQRQRLTRLAVCSIEHGAKNNSALSSNLVDWPRALQEPGSSFVTLHLQGELRGCVGGLYATRPLVHDISHHAYCAAFKDPRFAPLLPADIPDLSVHISVLSEPQTVRFTCAQELINLLYPGRDGLIVREGEKTATFLPEVWDTLPDPSDFLTQLKLKAGITSDWESRALTVERYTTESW